MAGSLSLTVGEPPGSDTEGSTWTHFKLAPEGTSVSLFSQPPQRGSLTNGTFLRFFVKAKCQTNLLCLYFPKHILQHCFVIFFSLHSESPLLHIDSKKRQILLCKTSSCLRQVYFCSDCRIMQNIYCTFYMYKIEYLVALIAQKKIHSQSNHCRLHLQSNIQDILDINRDPWASNAFLSCSKYSQ